MKVNIVSTDSSIHMKMLLCLLVTKKAEFLLFFERIRYYAGKFVITFSLIFLDFIDQLFLKLSVKVYLLSNGSCPKLLDFR